MSQTRIDPPLCATCARRYAADACEAFDRIPDEIITGQHDHRKPYEGDNGVRWEPLPAENSASLPVE